MTQGKVSERKFKIEEKFGRNEIETCPVCGKQGSHSFLARHVMNSRKEPKHGEFCDKQDEKILELFDNISVEEFSLYKIALYQGMYCSCSYARRILNKFRPGWLEKSHDHHIIDTSNQYKDGRRTVQHIFGNGWKASKELGTGCYMSREKRDSIIEAFKSDDMINKISETIGCKQETITKIWREEYGREECEKRLDRLYRFLKPSQENEQKIISLFNSDISMKEIADKFGTSGEHVRNIFVENFGKDQTDERAVKMKKLALLKMFKTIGNAAIAGSRPEIECYRLIKESYPNTILHDVDTIPPYEIDISIPDKKVAIEWNGPTHRFPIFGQKAFDKVLRNDAIKIQKLTSMGWVIISVDDDYKKFKPLIIKQTVEEIKEIIAKDYSHASFKVVNGA